jgi:hypothetical protein
MMNGFLLDHTWALGESKRAAGLRRAEERGAFLDRDRLISEPAPGLRERSDLGITR